MKNFFLKESTLNLSLYVALWFYRDVILGAEIPFDSQFMVAIFIAIFIVVAYLKSVENHGIVEVYIHHILLGIVAVLIFSVGQLTYEELTVIGFNFSQGKTGYYQYILLKTYCNVIGVLCLPSLIEFGRQEFKRLRYHNKIGGRS